eukprot:CAMPEP_0119070826 /NCGR_PEP_ID=MMETSP1178-20130426/43270_1 /TAXON_ID=33656 /ORGANISM="unid sp, Strain CCMP2000" /LENGTH=114 /DNA_ID=CAMNT_0007052701 /DNA_START=96 /DNA_END=440 /DNA_ORIENTATION=+
MVAVTQADNMGTLIHAECDNPLDASSGSYTTRVHLGRRDDEILEVYARTLVELMSKRGLVQPLLLAISIEAHSSQMFKTIMQEIDENLFGHVAGAPRDGSGVAGPRVHSNDMGA